MRSGARNAACVVFGLLAVAVQAGPVATVGGGQVSIETVRAVAARNGHDVTRPDSARKALDEAVTFELLAAEATRLGYDRDPDVVDQMKRMMVERLVKDKVDKALPREALTEEDLREYHEQHPEEFRKPGLVRGQVVKVLVRDGDIAAARQRAGEALALLKQGKPFADVVRTYSDDISGRAVGGVTNWIIEGRPNKRYPEAVTNALFALSSKEETAGPIETDRAVYLLKLVENRPGRVISFEEAKLGIGQKVYRAKRQAAYAEYCKQLRARFPVRIDEGQLRKLSEEARAGDGPPLGPVRVRKK